MQETVAQVLVLVRGAWRYRWAAIACAWLVAILGWTAITLLPDRYTSRTRVYMDTESLLKPLLSGLAVEREVTSEAQLVQTVMLSRPTLETVLSPRLFVRTRVRGVLHSGSRFRKVRNFGQTG